MKVLLAKFCDYACQVDGGKATMIGMFDTIGGAQFPLVHTTFFICVEFEFDPMEAGRQVQVKMVLIDEDGKELMGMEGHFNAPRAMEGRPATMFQTFRIEGLQFPRPGNYRLDIIERGEPIGEARLYLTQGPPPQHPYQPPPPNVS